MQALSPGRSLRRLTLVLGVLLVIQASVSPAPLAAAQERAPATQDERLSVQYRRLVGLYRGGQLEVIRTLADLRRSDLDKILENIFGTAPSEGRWTPAELRAAVVLHGEAALSLIESDLRQSAVHLEFGGQFLQKLGPPYRDLAVAWHVALAALFRANGHLPSAESLLAMGRKRLPNDPEVLFHSGLTAELQASHAATSSGPGTAAQRHTGWLANAEEWFRKSLSFDEVNPHPQLHLGRVQMLRGQNTAALKTLETLAPVAQDDVVRYLAVLFTGAIYDRLGQPSEAERHYRKASEIITTASSARIAVAEIVQRSGRQADAQQYLREFIERHTSERDPWWHYLQEPPRDAEARWINLRHSVQQ